MSLLNQLANSFKIYANLNPEVLEKCEQMCKSYNMSPDDLADEWGAYSACSLKNSIPTLAELENMERKEFAKRKGEFSAKTIISTPTSTKSSRDIMEEFDSNTMSPNICNTPKSGRNSIKRLRSPEKTILPKEDLNLSANLVSSPSINLESYNYEQRKNAGKIELSYGIQKLLKNAVFKRNKDYENVCVKLLSDGEALSPDVLYMFNVNHLKASYLNSKIEWFGKYLFRKFSLGDPQAFAKASGSITTYGQICCDSAEKLDSSSVLLEGSQELNNGNTINLNLSKLSNYAIFPGQTVAVQGYNPNGNTFTVQKLYSDACVNAGVNQNIVPTFTEPLQIVVAVGPFTLSNDLLYKPLQDLVSYVTSNVPHVLILVGPFLDSSQENICDITVTDLYYTFFEKLIDGIMTPLEGLNIKVVLVPSAKDAHHHIVYPTPPYKTRKTYPNLQYVGDPSILNIEGLTLGVTSTDVLLHLSKQELCNSAQGGDRISRLASHLLCQQSFYPLYPPHGDVCIDYELLEQHGVLGLIPNILILPSNLRYFVKYINGCVVINPERLTKGYVGGTFCRIEVAPKTTSGTVSDNVVAQIMRI